MLTINLMETKPGVSDYNVKISVGPSPPKFGGSIANSCVHLSNITLILIEWTHRSKLNINFFLSYLYSNRDLLTKFFSSRRAEDGSKKGSSRNVTEKYTVVIRLRKLIVLITLIVCNLLWTSFLLHRVLRGGSLYFVIYVRLWQLSLSRSEKNSHQLPLSFTFTLIPRSTQWTIKNVTFYFWL